MKILLLFVGLLLSSISISQSIEDKWITIDIDSGKEKSVVEIYKQDRQYYGKIVRFLEDGVANDAVCKHCKGKMKDKQLMGFNVLKSFKKDGNELINGTVTDPENDKTYDAKLWIDKENPDILNLRAYVSIIFKTIQWKRAK